MKKQAAWALGFSSLWLGLTGCGGGGGGGPGSGGGGSVAPVLTIAIPGSTALSRGAAITIDFSLSDPDDVVVASLYADADGSLLTVNDRTLLASGVPESGGTPLAICLPTTSLSPGTYGIVGTTSDGFNAPQAVLATGTLTLSDVGVIQRLGSTGTDATTCTFGDTATGRYCVGGNVSATTTLGVGTPTATTLTPDGQGGFLARYGANDALVWAKLLDGPGDAMAIVLAGAWLADDSVLVSGIVTGAVTFGPGELGQATLSDCGFVARFNFDGSLAWAKGFAPGVDLGRTLAARPGGEFVMAGALIGSATLGVGEPNQTSLVANGGEDVLLARFDAAGSLLWARQAGSDQLDEAASGVAWRPDASILVTGKYRGLATFGKDEPNQTTLQASGYSDGFVACYAGDGSLSWVRRAFGPGQTNGRTVSAQADNGAVVSGTYNNLTTFGLGEATETTIAPYGPSNFYLARYDANGSFSWVKRGGATGSGDGLRAVVVLPCGDLIASGYTQGGSLTVGEGEPNETHLAPRGPSGTEDFMVLRYAASGALVWARIFGGSGEDNTWAPFVAADESIRLVGSFSGTCYWSDPMLPAPILLTSAGGTDAFVARLNGDGLP